MAIAPRIEVYTLLACHVHRPEILTSVNQTGLLMTYGGLSIDGFDSATHVANYSQTPALFDYAASNRQAHAERALNMEYPVEESSIGASPSRRILCARDPIVQAAVAKLEAGECEQSGFLTQNLTLLQSNRPALVS